MTERRRLTSDPVNENDRQYLERTGVSNQVKEVLMKIIENRPEDPISFLADYFDTSGEKGSRATRAQQQICLTHHSRPAFENNLRIAYDILGQNRVNKNSRGVSGSNYMELITLLCIDFPGIVTEKLLRKIRIRDYEVVTFDVFCSEVFTCLVLQDYLKLTADLFKCLDQTGSSKIERPLAEAVLSQLSKAVRCEKDGISGVLEAGYMLSPPNLHQTLSQALLQTSENKKTMALEEFQSVAADSFISQVKPLR